MTTPGKDSSQLRVGDIVVTNFYADGANVRRRLTMIQPSTAHGSGYVASADAGDPCPACKRPFAEPIRSVDAAWFRLAEEVTPCKDGGGVAAMSLRDYFAAAALSGMVARPTFYQDYCKHTGVDEEKAAAHYAYALADAMLAEREKGVML